MSFIFTKKDIEKISNILNCQPTQSSDAWSWQMENKETSQEIVFSVHNKVALGGDTEGALISVQTHHGYFELHDCSGYFIFDPDEVIFIQNTGDKISSMSIGKQATCSLYSNISKDIISSDFAALDPAVLLSAMQLSIVDSFLSEPPIE